MTKLYERKWKFWPESIVFKIKSCYLRVVNKSSCETLFFLQTDSCEGTSSSTSDNGDETTQEFNLDEVLRNFFQPEILSEINENGADPMMKTSRKRPHASESSNNARRKRVSPWKETSHEVFFKSFSSYSTIPGTLLTPMCFFCSTFRMCFFVPCSAFVLFFPRSAHLSADSVILLETMFLAELGNARDELCKIYYPTVMGWAEFRIKCASWTEISAFRTSAIYFCLLFRIPP